MESIPSPFSTVQFPRRCCYGHQNIEASVVRHASVARRDWRSELFAFVRELEPRLQLRNKVLEAGSKKQKPRKYRQE